MTYVIGLTGGIGSGKSAVADLFAAEGAVVVDTDVIAHELTRPGGAAIEPLKQLFGVDCISPDGSMDRKKVRDLAFNDPVAKQKLEALLHPMIRAESQRRIAAARSAPYVVHVVPLLVESQDYRSRVQRVAVVDCTEEVQVARVKARSGLSEDEVRRIIEAQAPRARRLAAADDVIDNSGPLTSLPGQVLALHQRYIELAKVTRADR